jgi:hypothetical protein
MFTFRSFGVTFVQFLRYLHITAKLDIHGDVDNRIPKYCQ